MPAWVHRAAPPLRASNAPVLMHSMICLALSMLGWLTLKSILACSQHRAVPRRQRRQRAGSAVAVGARGRVRGLLHGAGRPHSAHGAGAVARAAHLRPGGPVCAAWQLCGTVIMAYADMHLGRRAGWPALALYPYEPQHMPMGTQLV